MTAFKRPSLLDENYDTRGETNNQIFIKRIGQIGDKISPDDNGFYTCGFVNGQSANFLVDNGSTVTLLSYHKFNEIAFDKRPNLSETNMVINDVNGKKIKTYGVTLLTIKLGNVEYETNVLICEISFDAILGQDFLLKFINKIDYKRMIRE